MKDAYIVKKSVSRNILRPSKFIAYDQFVSLVESSDKLTWYEETKFGKRFHERYPDKKKKHVSYLNIDEADEKSFVQVQFSQFGYIRIRFDFKSTKKNLSDLIDLANTINCNLWQFKPRRQILTHEMVSNRYKQTKPRKKPQTEIIAPDIWFYIQGEFGAFLKVFKPSIIKTTGTIAKINNNNKTNNKIVILKISNDTFYVTGIGIKYLYEKEFHPEKSKDYKDKFKYQLNAIFKEVLHHDSKDQLKTLDLESQLLSILKEKVQSKSEILVGKVQKRLF